MNFSQISNRSVMGRILRAPLRLIPDEMPVPILQGRLRGKRWIAGSHTHGCWLGSYESEKQGLFASSIKAGDVVFDIGANVGFYTLLASVLVGAGGHVYAFEPLPRNLRFLREHLRLNGIGNVEVIEAAVSDSTGESWFEESPSAAMGHLSRGGSVKVKTVTIDELVAQSRVRPPTTLKIDIEGAETKALNGARVTLQKSHPKIFLSTHGPKEHRQSCELLERLGYRLDGIDGESALNSDELLAN